MSGDFDFSYKNLTGNLQISSLINLQVVAEGPVDLGDGWLGDRVNYDKKNNCLIEFRTGMERTPGHVENYAIEVDINYVIKHYNISKEKIEALKE